jgi:6-pyruvoyltetrahydropterin/6-carboxytetrahydropterin synthase
VILSIFAAVNYKNILRMVYITKQVHFCAAHRLYNPNWNDEKNEEVFGPCANKNWHGHNFDLYVTIKGDPDPDTGFVMNFKDLKKTVKDEVLEFVDHKNLNIDVPFMKDKLTSCENLIIEFWNILEPLIKEESGGRASLHALKLYETPTSYAEYYG